ncbi:MAG: hypothetical protein R3D03_07735 [Geminicoccaceae bacterium]
MQAPLTDLPTLSSGIDLALRYGTGKWNDGRTVRLFDERIGPVAIPHWSAAAAAGTLSNGPRSSMYAVRTIHTGQAGKTIWAIAA